MYLWLALISLVAASQWSFSSGTLEIAGRTHTFSNTPLTISFSRTDKFKLSYTTLLDGTPKRPHQNMIILKNGQEGNLVVPTKSTGKGSITINARDINDYLLIGPSLEISIIIAGGDTTGLFKTIAKLELTSSPDSPFIAPTSVGYGPRAEITHTFRPAQRMPPIAISVLFSIVLAVLPLGLLIGWHITGANMNAASDAMRNAPIAYPVFFASVCAIEGVLFMYWLRLTLMPVLGMIAGLSIPLFFSGRAALVDVERRRKAGKR